MKVREKLIRNIRNNLIRACVCVVAAIAAFFWLTAMPRVFGFLIAGAMIFLVDAVLNFIKYRRAGALLDEMISRSVTVREIDGNKIALEGQNPVLWDEILEIRKVYRAVGHGFVIFLPRTSTAATRRFFYVLRLRDGQWLELSNINFVSSKGSLKDSALKSPEAVSLLGRLLTEAMKHPGILLKHHDEVAGTVEAFDCQKELEYLAKLEKRAV